MSLNRFTNKDNILESNGFLPGSIWSKELIDQGLLVTTPLNKSDSLKDDMIVEVHLYSKENDGAYINSVDNIQYQFNAYHNILLDVSQLSSLFQIRTGRYNIVFNFLKNFIGSSTTPAFYIKEISTDRTEIYLRANSDTSIEGISNIAEDWIENPQMRRISVSGNLLVNFGKGELNVISNFATWADTDGVRIKLLTPLSEDVVENGLCWITQEIVDSVTDDIEFYFDDASNRVVIRNANFDISSQYNTITETGYKHWNSLLGESTSTSQQIVDNMFSGSLDKTKIPIDYSGFQNFIHFSSAKERVANFKYKMELIEFYNSQIGYLDAASSTDITLQNNVSVTTKRKNEVIGSFDGFERWLYNEPTASLFTHQTVYDEEHDKGNPTRLEGGLIGADTYQITPWPKFISSSHGTGDYKRHHSSASIATAWYQGTFASASSYDTENPDILLKTIPEHIRSDSNNDQYELFVNMIAHHFDILYSYIDALSKTYHPIEHPKLGHSKDTLFKVAESMGWSLANGNQASALWQYKLGKSETGSFASIPTGSLFSKSDEEITTEVWRRIVNNLPYLLKTKGTARSIKALMNTYGIPQTLLSIREYGGPKVAEDVPLLIEDRFNYGLNMNGSGSVIRMTRAAQSSSIPDKNWGIPIHDNPTFVTASANANIYTSVLSSTRPTDTIELRFKPAISESMLLLSNARSSDADDRVPDDAVLWNLGIEHATGSYSGSSEYGRLFFQMRTYGGGAEVSASEDFTKFTDYVPLYDGDFWNVRLWTEFPWISASNTPDSADIIPHIYFQTQKASDYITGKVVHSTSGSFMPGSGSDLGSSLLVQLGWCQDDDRANEHNLWLGGATHSRAADNSGLHGDIRQVQNYFSGSIQEYREWMEVLDQKTFDLHTLNPTSYVSSISPSSSYDTLTKHYPFGTDLNAIDHSTGPGLIISSSHPANHIKHFGTPEVQLDADSHPDTFAYAGVNTSSTYESSFPTPSNVQRGNYLPVEETYYIQGVSLGGTLPKSQKIRFDENRLEGRLSPENTVERSKFELASIDSNKLGLFYSMADQINKDIFNHIGDVALDDYIGDPDDEHEEYYPDLTAFSNEYWKKYSDRNDINAYSRIFSQFDFSLFNQIKQLLPDRVDDVMGLLVEPHALERKKLRLTKPLQHERNDYDLRIKDMTPTASAVYSLIEGTISGSPSISVPDTTYHVSNETSGSGNRMGYKELGNYIGPIGSTAITGSSDYFNVGFIPPSDELGGITSSLIALYTIIGDNSGSNWSQFGINTFLGTGSISESIGDTSLGAQNSVTDKIRCQFDTYNQTETIQDLHFDITHRDVNHVSADSGSATASIQMKILTTPNNVHGMHNHEIGTEGQFIYLARTPLNGDLVGRAIQERSEIVTITGSSYVTNRFTFRNIHVEPRTNVTFEFNYNHLFVSTSLDVTEVPTQLVNVDISKVSLINKLRKQSNGFGDQLHDTQIVEPRPSKIFSTKVLHYSTGSYHLNRFIKNANVAYSASLEQSYSSSLVIASYQDDLNDQTDRLKFLGSRIQAPGINLASGYIELGYAPIIEVYAANPNQIIYTSAPDLSQGDNPGNLIIEAPEKPLLDAAGQPVSPIQPSARPQTSQLYGNTR